MPETSARPKIYLAGPEVFLRRPHETGDAKIAICARHGLDGKFPLDSGLDLSGLTVRERGYAIFRANEAMIAGCDALIANMTPFRGPNMDAGTAFEIGFMRALGKPVFGYSNVADLLFDRVAKSDRKGFKRRKIPLPGMVFEDSHKLGVEQFGFVDNLMIDAAIHESGATVVTGKTRRRERYTDLAAFEACVQQVAERLGVGV
jgi:nucleoside 2-deoxyribosyltransferase